MKKPKFSAPSLVPGELKNAIIRFRLYVDFKNQIFKMMKLGELACSLTIKLDVKY